MAVDLSITRERVQRYMTEMTSSVTVDEMGYFSARAGSARVFVRVSEHPDGESTMVQVFAVLVEDVPLTPELFEFVATDASTVFGTLLVVKRTDTTGAIIMRHPLLGDYLDAAEFEYAVGGVASSADEIDDELAARFGGTVFHPEANAEK